MKAFHFLFFAGCVLASGCPAFAQDRVGETVYVEGGVSLDRDGQPLDQSEIQTGLGIENFDIVRTGSDGLAEVSVDNPRIPPMTIKVSPRTQFSFELSKLGPRQQASVGLMGGTVALKVAKLGAAQSLNVVLDNAVMGVRGTEFTVTTTPAGDVLVVCGSGDVALTDETGKEVHAIPGTAVEKRAGQGFAALAIGGTEPDDFLRKWQDERISAFKADALSVIQHEAQRYERLADEYAEDYAAFQEKRDVLARWESEEKSGTAGTGNDVEKEKAEIADLLADLRETQFLLERAHFRLAALEEYHAQGFGRGAIRNGLTTSDFFDRFDKDRGKLEREMASVWLAVKLFAHRNEGVDPTFVTDLKLYYERRLAHLREREREKLVKKGK